MEDNHTILAVDQGTTSTRAMLFDRNGEAIAQHSKEVKQIFPFDGWVEHDPEDIWTGVLEVIKNVIAEADKTGHIVLSMGITNQRETAVAWDRVTGKPIYNAIVWQDRRTTKFCENLKAIGHEKLVAQKTGLLLDPYFSASKFSWIIENVEGARKLANSERLCFGTIDSFLIWKLTGGKRHVTDATNASRTSLFNIHENRWDEELLDLFQIPRICLPEVLDCSANFGNCEYKIFELHLPISGVAGDQQAASIGQACFDRGSLKCTFGTGSFLIINTGNHAVISKSNLLTTINYRLNGQTTYAVEGSIFISGAIIQWLRDNLNFIEKAAETEVIAKNMEGNNGVYLVPALTGLGAPYWEPEARGAIFGLTRNTRPADLIRAALESVAYQTADLFEAIEEDGIKLFKVKIDGGMTSNDWLMQFVADITDVPLERPKIKETTALGAAMLALLTLEPTLSLKDIAKLWRSDATFSPKMDIKVRDQLLSDWSLAVRRTVTGIN